MYQWKHIQTTDPWNIDFNTDIFNTESASKYADYFVVHETTAHRPVMD